VWSRGSLLQPGSLVVAPNNVRSPILSLELRTWATHNPDPDPDSDPDEGREGGSGRAGIMAVGKNTAYRSADVDCAEMVS